MTWRSTVAESTSAGVILVRRAVADDPDREQFPELVAAVNEDPARFLDHDLATEHDGRRLAIARIDAIDRLGVVNAWIQVERQLDRGPREPIIELLEQRREWILEHGGRDDRLEDGDERTPAAPKRVLWIDEDGEPYERSSADERLEERLDRAEQEAVATDEGVS